MTVRALALIVLLAAACSRGGAPQSLPSTPAALTEPAVSASDGSEGASEPTVTASESETVDASLPLAALAVIPGVSDNDAWVTVGPATTVDGFAQWRKDRGVRGPAADLAEELDEAYGFQSEVQVAFVHRRSPRPDAPRSRQLLVSRFERSDDGLSEAWCSVDEEGRDAVELGSSAQVQRAVDRLVALPGSCGAVHEVSSDPPRFQADISFRRGPFMVQVVAIEQEPVKALRALARVAPAVNEHVVKLTD